jgi:hypothetical protein
LGLAPDAACSSKADMGINAAIESAVNLYHKRDVFIHRSITTG